MPPGRPRRIVPPCRHCNKTFKRKEHLARHERTHTNERPYSCGCGQNFTRQDLLTRHVHVSHSSSRHRSITPVQTDDQGIVPHQFAIDAAAIDQAVNPDEHSALGGFDDFFWDPDLMNLDMLPASVFDGISEPLPVVQDPHVGVEESPVQKSRFAQFSSRLPTLDDFDRIAHDEETEDSTTNEPCKLIAKHADALEPEPTVPWILDNACYEALFAQVLDFAAVLPNGVLIPSQNVLMRCLEKYMRCGNEFLPIVHCASFRAGGKPVELVLAMAGVGSRYLFEAEQSYGLYAVAKAIVFERVRREELRYAAAVSSLERDDESSLSEGEKVERLQTLVLLAELASWADRRISRHAPFLTSHLAALAKQCGISTSDEMAADLSWEAWVFTEERRRTLFAAFIISNLHSIAFGSAPLVLNHQIGLCLPGHAAQWRAASAATWKSMPRQPELHFQARIHCLFSSYDDVEELEISSFGNYVLIQGLIQEMYQHHHSLAFTTMNHRDSATETFVQALHKWQKGWEVTRESYHDSELDPLYAKGPFALTSAALFRLAHIRLVTGHDDSKRLLVSRDPRCEIQIRDEDALPRSPHVHRAVLHAAHSLSVPVRLGIAFMKTTKTGIWSVEHSLCSLESALFLKAWLDTLAATVASSRNHALQKVENQLLVIVRDIIEGTPMASILSSDINSATNIRQMGRIVLEIWSAIFQGVNVLEIENVIGAGLQAALDTTTTTTTTTACSY